MKCNNQQNRFRQRARRNAGFTLIELMVVIIIFVILTAVVLFNQNNFDGSVLLQNLAYDIALTVRQAQTYGVNTNETSFITAGGVASSTFSSYGVYFNTASGSGSNLSYVMFSDITGSGEYTGTVLSCPTSVASNECIQKYAITGGNEISNICVVTSANATCNAVSNLTLLFERPNPNAIISVNTGSGELTTYDGSPITEAEITVSPESSSNNTQTIFVSTTGEIYVQ